MKLSCVTYYYISFKIELNTFFFRNFSCKAGPASRFRTWWLFAKSWFHETEDSVWRSSQKNVQTSSLHRLPRSHSCKSYSGYCISGNNYTHISINVFYQRIQWKIRCIQKQTTRLEDFYFMQLCRFCLLKKTALILLNNTNEENTWFYFLPFDKNILNMS